MSGESVVARAPLRVRSVRHHTECMVYAKRYTRQEKVDLLTSYAAAVTHNPDHVEVWLEMVELKAEQLAGWRTQLQSGTLGGDYMEVPENFHSDGSLAALANLYRAQITQVKPGAHTVPVGSAAGLVVYGPDGNWRLDYLARALSALKAVIAAAEAAPERFLRPNATASSEASPGEGQRDKAAPLAPTPAEAVAKARAAWGIDRFPLTERPALAPAGADADARKAATRAREAADKRMARWTEQLAGNPLAYDALLDWYHAQEPPLIDLPIHTESTAPTWANADPTQWPPEGEGRWLNDMAKDLLEEALSVARLGDDRQRIIVLRRTVEAISAYIGASAQLPGAKIYYQHHVVRQWQWYAMEDLRTDEERRGTVKTSATDKPIIAAVAAMCLHTVLRNWDPQAAQATMTRAVDIFRPLSPTGREQKERERAIGHRLAQARVPRLQEVPKSNHPAFIRGVSSNVARLFFESELLRMAPSAPMADRYLEARRAILLHDREQGNGHRVIQLADYSANLAVASPGARKELRPDQVRDLRVALLKSTEGDPLQAAVRRNDALSIQKRSFDGAIAEGQRGLDVLRRQRKKGATVERDQLIMEEQLCMNLAGSAVQWLEHLLAGDPVWQKSIEQRQWVLLTNLALHESDRAVEIIEKLYIDGELEGQRYANDGFLADGNFLYRAWDILYRCTCAAATAALAFPSANLKEDIAKHHDFPHLLNEVHLAVTTIDKPIVIGELPRLLHSMLWHSFLAGGVLPALKPDTLNSSLIGLDPLTRVLTPEEIADPNCKTVMTYKRISLLTDELIRRGWTAGAIGTIKKGSRVWDVLDECSGGLFSVWRDQFDGLLLNARDEEAPSPPRKGPSFYEKFPALGGVPVPEPDEEKPGGRTDWGGARGGLISPAYPPAKPDTDDEDR